MRAPRTGAPRMRSSAPRGRQMPRLAREAYELLLDTFDQEQPALGAA
jgi:hypothetical protein